jgi:hypothetical protein
MPQHTGASLLYKEGVRLSNELIEVYKRLKEILKRYENPLKSKFDFDSRYDLWSVKELVIDGRKRKEVSFAALIIQSNYVGFYYMPVYTDVDLKSVFGPELLKLLKGKSCFHIKELNDLLEKQIIEALDLGYSLYKERGWI